MKRNVVLLILIAVSLLACGSDVTPTPPPTPRPTLEATATTEPTATLGATPQVLVDDPTPTPTATPICVTPGPEPQALVDLPPDPGPDPLPGQQATLIRVIDGDTIEVDIGGQSYRVRYIGMNTPETDQPGGSEATEVNRQLLEGQTVQLEKDVSETDRYGRLLRYVYVGGLFINAELVRLGYAQAATYPPDVRHADLFVELEREAREAGRGLWAAPPAPSPPAGWNCVGNLYNCGDFSSCDEVMSYWNTCPGDPSRLDGDNNGVPCESLCR